MSYTIEYNRKVYIDKEKNETEPNYLLLIKQGDSNVYDPVTKLRARDWDFIVYGWEYRLWNEIGRRGGATEGGSLQRAVGWQGTKWWSIEEYIALYRKAIKNAKPIEKILEDFDIEVEINIVDENKEKTKEDEKEYKYDEYEMKKVQEFLKKYQFQEDGYQYYYPQIKRWIRKIETLEEFKDYLNHLTRGQYGTGLWTELHFHEKRKR